MIIIRSARPNEVKKLQNLNDEVFLDNPKYDPDVKVEWAQSEVGEEYFITAINSSEGCFFVAEDNGRLIGYIAASSKTFDDRNSSYVEIDNLGVIGSYRKQGAGKKLMNRCLKWAKDKGFKKAHLRCYSANVGALEFYKRNGFQDISVSLERSL
jgi:ribosomal protein S18 acetylase RimI-like enzyme